MNPQLSETPGLDLPSPSFDEALPPISGTPGAFHASSVPEPDFTSVAVPQRPSIPITDPPLSASATDDTISSSSVNPRNAATPQADYESSVIDREWIDKAREIVEITHADPYLQSREISRIKAEYIKARYNKEIKSVED